MGDFKESRPLTGIKDTEILKFFNKHNIRLMHVDSCNNYFFNDSTSPFTTCGKKLELYFNGTPVVLNVHAIIFDYSKVPLILYETLDNEKHKIADRFICSKDLS